MGGNQPLENHYSISGQMVMEDDREIVQDHPHSGKMLGNSHPCPALQFLCRLRMVSISLVTKDRADMSS